MSIPPNRNALRNTPPLNARDRALSQWRGLNVRQNEVLRNNRLQSAATLVPQLLKSLRMDRRQAESEVLRVWNNLIDPNIVAHAQPTGLAKGTLFVTVDSSVWLDEIVRYRRREILDRLQYGFGRELIQKISFRVG